MTACGSNGDSTKKYIDILKKDSYTASYLGDFEGVKMNVTSFVSGDNFELIYRNPRGTDYHMVMIDGTLYDVLRSVEVYAIVKSGEIPYVSFNISDYDYSTAKYVKSGKNILNRNEYSYDEYTVSEKNGKERITINIYTFNGDIYAYSVPERDIVLYIQKLSNELPENACTIPDHFQEIPFEEIENYFI